MRRTQKEKSRPGLPLTFLLTCL